MSFRLSTKNVFLTYAQCPIDKAIIHQYFIEEFNTNHVITAREEHVDGNAHIHVYVRFHKKFDTKNARAFDIEGHHPNVAPCKNIAATINYTKKDGDYLEYTKDEEEDLNLYELAKTTPHDKYFEECRKNKIQFQYAKEAWITSNQVDATIRPDDEVKGTFASELNWFEAPHTLKATVIVGPSGIGKTVYAKTKATKPALFVTHMDDLKHFKPNFHKSLIFDDMSFSHMPITAQIHLADAYEPRSIHVRYGTVKLPAGIEKWITCNEQPFSEHPAIRRRINLIHLY